jgi:hypothetical protein
LGLSTLLEKIFLRLWNGWRGLIFDWGSNKVVTITWQGFDNGKWGCRLDMNWLFLLAYRFFGVNEPDNIKFHAYR